MAEKEERRKPVVSDGKEGTPALSGKELAESRKRQRRPNFDLEKDLVMMWERIRQRSLPDEDRSRLVTRALARMKGKLAALVVAPSTSRVVQACVKHCTAAERDAVFEELRPQCLELAKNTYASFLVNKMIDQASKAQRDQIFALFHGKVVALLRHPAASQVVEALYLSGNASQKQALLSEFYSPEYRLFKGVQSAGRGRLAELIAEAPQARKRSLLEHVNAALMPLLEKGYVSPSIVHRALAELLAVAPKDMCDDLVRDLSEKGTLVQMLHTKEGARVGSLCVDLGSAKERKKIVKGLKGHVLKVAMDSYGHLVLLHVLEAVDDTQLVRKVVFAELNKEVLALALHKFGRRLLLHLLAPRAPRYFPQDVIAALPVQPLLTPVQVDKEGTAAKPSESAAEEPPTAVQGKKRKRPKKSDVDKGEGEEEEEEGEEDGEDRVRSKKDPSVRRWELLNDSGLAEALVTTCAAHAQRLLCSREGTEVLYEVASGGTGGIMWKASPEGVQSVHRAIAALAALPRPDPSERASLTKEPQPPTSAAKAPRKKKKKTLVNPDKTENNEGGETNGGEPSGQEDGEAEEGAGEAEGKGAVGAAVPEVGPLEHVLENFFSTRTLRRLLLDSPPPPPESEALPFAAVLWEGALKGRCHLWAEGHSAKVVAALASSTQHAPTRKAIHKELLPMLGEGGALTSVRQLLPKELGGAGGSSNGRPALESGGGDRENGREGKKAKGRQGVKRDVEVAQAAVAREEEEAGAESVRNGSGVVEEPASSQSTKDKAKEKSKVARVQANEERLDGPPVKRVKKKKAQI
eukprot:TRINITY_DN6505_c0_g1_i1.p1 TRINITY_DN6505_c0_g1~~TRINITY_DN6505_c0_g1_i1.p1  ORF type:complete len:806 (-),score=206.28 TRINITY_DN6505_c0_g1_i1:86-2503(-)